MTKVISGRRAARICVAQAVYSFLISEQNPLDFERSLLAQEYSRMYEEFEQASALKLAQIDEKYYRTCIHGILVNQGELNEALSPHLDRQIGELGVTEHALLLLGAYELLHQQDVPYKVVINEAIELAKYFGAQESYKYVNGVLDKLNTALAQSQASAFA